MSTPEFRKTSIIITLGPATDSPEKLAELIDNGVDVFRLNMSHAQHDWCREVVHNIRKIGNSKKTVMWRFFLTYRDLPSELEI